MSQISCNKAEVSVHRCVDLNEFFAFALSRLLKYMYNKKNNPTERSTSNAGENLSDDG